jgi:RNAse (barnase) inhibitor barstar
MKKIKIDGSKIKDWNSFHEVFQHTFGFLEGYGKNGDAWIDCMGDIHNDTGMSKVRVPAQEPLLLQIDDTQSIEDSCPEVLEGLSGMIAFVNNNRLLNNGQSPIYLLLV